MRNVLLIVLALGLVCLPVTAAQAQGLNQGNGQGLQSLRPTLTPCGAGSQSVRVCNDDFRSCNSICSATALDASADIAGCGTRCCSQFNACLRLRGCATRIIDCF